MLKLLLGDEIYSKQQFLNQILAKNGLEMTKYDSSQNLPKLGSLSGQSLFGAGQLHVFLNCLNQYELPELEAASAGTAEIVFIEDSLDKRLTKTKEIMKLAEVTEFPAPTDREASSWIIDHATSLGINIQPAASAELAKRLMGETKRTLPTLSAHQELLKLSNFAGGKTITKVMVEELTTPDLAIDLFNLLDQIGTKNKSAVINLLTHYYDSSSEDDKVLTIRLSALLAGQFRSLLIAKEAAQSGLSDKEILAATGWKSGRLFIMKKISGNFTNKQLVDSLGKFYNLDKELKNSTLPARVIIDMIVATI